MAKNLKLHLAFILIFVGISVGSLSILGASQSWSSLEKPNLFSGRDAATPVAGFTFSPDGDCATVAVKFTNTSTGADLTYEWDFGDGTNSTQKDPSHTFVGAHGIGTRQFNVKLTVTDSTGATAVENKTVSVKELPSMAITSVQETTTFENLPYFIVCDSKPFEFTFYNAEGAFENNNRYQIDWGDGSPAFDGADWTELKHSYNIGIYHITYTVTPANGCVTTKRYGVFIGSNPAVGLANPGNTNVCVGEELTFPITGTENNPDGTTYTVTFSDGSAPQVFTHPPPASVSHIFTEGSCGRYADSFQNSFSVKIVARNPCSASQASVVPIYVSKPPEPEFTASSETVCVDELVTFGNTTEFNTEVSTTGNCNDTKRFVWEITPATGWTLESGVLGAQPNPDAPNSWSSGSETITPKFTAPGTYTIKLKTGNRCGQGEITKEVKVIPRPAPSFTLPSDEVCGPATVTATNTSNILGHDGDGTYTWAVAYSRGDCGTSSDWDFAPGSDRNSENPSFVFTNPGVYTISLTMQAVCGTFRSEEKITVVAPPTVSIAAIPSTCGPVTFTPKATVTACGADQPSYKWTFEGGTPATSNLLEPGTVSFSSVGTKKITLEVTSACGTTTAEQTFTISTPPVIDLGETREICNGESIELSGLITVGSGSYTYQWTSNPLSSIPSPNSASIMVTPSQTTTYTLAVTDQNTNCTNTEQVVVNVIPAPTIQFDLPDQEICSGETSQAVLLSSLPGGESITWTSAAGDVSGATASGMSEIPAQTLINKTTQPVKVTYTAVIPNPSSGDCSLIPATYTITVNPEPSYPDGTLSICSDEELDFRPAGLLPGSSFTWIVDAPSGIVGATNASQAATSIRQELRNTTTQPLELTYTVTPYLGTCAGETFSLSVTVQPSPGIDFSQPDQVLCTGSITEEVAFTSDVPGATFAWTADAKGVQGVAAAGSATSIPVQTLVNPTDRPITVEYYVTVATNTGGLCAGAPKIHRITVNPSIQLSEEVSDYSGYQISCYGAGDGHIRLSPSGGSGNFNYSWTGPSGFSSSNASIENLAPGTYQVSIDDGFGCTVSRSFEIKEPQKITATVSSTSDILCAGDHTGAIRLNVAGGIDTEAYQFEWKRNGAIFPATTQDLSDIPAGSYDVTVLDANGCTSIITGIEITEPAAPILINYTKTDISCYGANDGRLELDVSGGLPPYSIQWSFGSSQSAFDNLGPGDYTLTVSDQSGCIRSQTITIADAPMFVTDPRVKNISCFGAKDGSIELNLQGGVGATHIRWDHGAELENLYNLPAGIYGVTITDQTDCEIRGEYHIIEPALLTTESQIDDALDCDNPQSGNILLGISGGTPPYTILWSNGQTSQNLTGIPAGQYAVRITDAGGCTVSGNFEVKRPPALAIDVFRSSSAQCEPRLIEEKIQVTVSGGAAPYDITWSGGSISSDKKTMTTTEPGYYQVTVVDGQGCSTSRSFEIENNETIVDAAIESAAFDQYNSYLVNFEISFWNRSFGNILTYHWDFGDGTQSFDEHPKHTYEGPGDFEITLTVTDVFGCSLQVKKKISVLDYYLVVPNVFTPNGDGINDYFFPKFVGIESLEFWVLNKWGETIFHTDDPHSQGWDGMLNNEHATPGNYVYKLNFKTLDGRSQSATDLFMLLK